MTKVLARREAVLGSGLIAASIGLSVLRETCVKTGMTGVEVKLC